MKRIFFMAALALCAITTAQGDTLAKASTKTWQLTLEGTDDDTSDDCTLNLVAWRAQGLGPQGTHEISLREKFYHCSFYGDAQITADEGAHATLVFVQGARGGDGDHTGPVVAVYRLTGKGFSKLGQQELFEAQYQRRAGHIVAVSGKVLFSFCGVCDGPDAGPPEDNIFVPATLRLGCGGICVKPAVSAQQRAALITKFERRRDALAKEPSNGDDDGTDAKKLEQAFREFLRRR